MPNELKRIIYIILLIIFSKISFLQASDINFGNFTNYSLSADKGLCSIAGSVKDETRKPIYQAIITISKNNFSFSTLSDRAGIFYIGNIPAGTYEIFIYKGGYEIYAQSINIQRHKSIEMSIVLSKNIILPQGYVLGKVVDVYKQPLNNAKVSLSDISFSRTNTDGIFVLKIVSEEIINLYNLKIQKDGFVPYENNVVLTNNQFNSIPTIQLTPSYSAFSAEIMVADTKNFRGIRINSAGENILEEIRPGGFVHDIQMLSDGTIITICGGEINYGYFLKIINPDRSEKRYINYGIIYAEKLQVQDWMLILNYKNSEIKEATIDMENERSFLGLSFLKLKNPSDVRKLSNNNLLIADSGNNRVIEVICDEEKLCKIGWEYSEGLKFPTSAEKLPTGDILITDRDNHRVIKVSMERKILLEYKEGLSFPTYSQSLPNGNILITDTGNNRIIEIAPNNKVVWTSSNYIKLNYPKRARKLF